MGCVVAIAIAVILYLLRWVIVGAIIIDHAGHFIVGCFVVLGICAVLIKWSTHGNASEGADSIREEPTVQGGAVLPCDSRRNLDYAKWTAKEWDEWKIECLNKRRRPESPKDWTPEECEDWKREEWLRITQQPKAIKRRKTPAIDELGKSKKAKRSTR